MINLRWTSLKTAAAAEAKLGGQTSRQTSVQGRHADGADDTDGAHSAGSRWLVDVEGLSVDFPHLHSARPLVRGVNLQIAPGECIALVGESGSGKSLTARSLLGLAGNGTTAARVKATRFDISGRSALAFRERDWRAIRGTFAGLVLQDALVSLDPLRPIGTEVGEVLAHHGLGGARRKRAKLILDVMRGVGIPDPEKRARQYAHELSGGLRQRALIASAIAAGPALIIADEPTTALDVSVQAQVLAVLRQRLESGVGVLLISHDLGVVSHIADRVLVMHQGEVVDSGTVQELLVRPSHPYTRQLIAARPSAQSRGHRLSSARFAQEGVHVDSHPDEAFVVIRDLAPVRAPSTPEIVLLVDGLTKRYGNGKLLSQNKALLSQPKGGAALGGLDDDVEASAAQSTRQRASNASYGLDGVSFTVHRGEVVGIVGESGSGKTTCGNIVLGLLTPDSGNVAFLGQTWSGAGIAEAARRVLRPKMQAIPQDPLSSFDPRYTIGELLTQSLYSRKLSASDRLSVSVDLLEKVGLKADFLARRPATLSGGQRQRVAIARALAPEPSLIVCDEPVSALDVYVQAQVLDLLLELQARLSLSLLFISHDLGVIRHVSDRVLVFKDGRIVEAGATESVFDMPSHEYTRSLLAETMSF